jgi:hypothetical protein
VPVWEWVVVAVAAWVAVSVAVAFTLATALGRLARTDTTDSEHKHVLEAAAWAAARLLRERQSARRARKDVPIRR